MANWFLNTCACAFEIDKDAEFVAVIEKCEEHAHLEGKECFDAAYAKCLAASEG